MKTRDRHAGIATVEFAISVIFMLFLMLVVAEVGRAYYFYNTLVKTVRSGAGYLSTNSYFGDLIDTGVNRSTAVNLVLSGRVDGGAPLLPGFVADNVIISEVYPDSTWHISVAANYNYVPMIGFIPDFGLGGGPVELAFTMQAESIMRVINR